MKNRLVFGVLSAIVVYGSVYSAGEMFVAASEPSPQGFLATLALKGHPAEKTRGMAVFELSEDGTSLKYKVEVHDLRDITMAHIHLGRPGDTTTPVAWLYPPSPPPKLIPGEFDGVLAQGTITSKDLIGPLRGKPLSALIARINAGDAFVNIHARGSVAGEICGSIECPPR